MLNPNWIAYFIAIIKTNGGRKYGIISSIYG
jgi:hypothetical protein